MKAFLDRIYVPFWGLGIPEKPREVFTHIDPIVSNDLVTYSSLVEQVKSW
jgi:hypothetical protein